MSLEPHFVNNSCMDVGQHPQGMCDALNLRVMRWFDNVPAPSCSQLVRASVGCTGRMLLHSKSGLTATSLLG